MRAISLDRLKEMLGSYDGGYLTAVDYISRVYGGAKMDSDGQLGLIGILSPCDSYAAPHQIQQEAPDSRQLCLQFPMTPGEMNKPESHLFKILEWMFPGQFLWVGFETAVANRWKPDFVCSESKLIVEMFGDYWHRNDNPKNRIALFQKHGFRTAIVWEQSLKNEELVKKRLRDFVCGNLQSAVIG